MSTPYAADPANVRRLAGKITDVESEVSSLQSELEDANRSHREDIADLQGLLTDRTYEIEELQSTVSSMETELGLLTKQVASIADRSAWLERHIRASGTAKDADFDSQPTSLHVAIDAVHRGHSLHEQLIDDSHRWFLERTIEEAAAREEQAKGLTAAALAANKILISTAYDTTEHLAAAERFRTAYDQRQKLLVVHSEKAVALDESRRELLAANTFRDTSSSDIAAGQAAERSLRTRMRTLVADAIGSGALPPVWFSTGLGVTAPRDDPDGWLDLAANVLAHRALYDISDPVLALGPPPHTTASAVEKRAHRRLYVQLQSL